MYCRSGWGVFSLLGGPFGVFTLPLYRHQNPCQVPNGRGKKGRLATFIAKAIAFRQRIVSLLSKTAISLWSEFLASLLGHVRHIEANGDLFLGHPQTQNRRFRFEKRTQ